MASGTITGTTANQYIDSRIVWSSAADNDANSSLVVASLQYKRNNSGYQTYGTGSFSLKILNTTHTATKTLTITDDAWVTALTARATVPHNWDGKRSVTISAGGSISGTTLTSTSCSGTATLDTIPRASTITSAADKTLTQYCSVKWTPLSTSFRYKLKFSLGGWSYTTKAIHPNTTSAYTYTGYTLPLDVANQLPKTDTGTMTVTLYTFSDTSATTQIGSASSKTFTVTVPENTSTKPTVTMSLAPVSSLGSTFSSLYIQGKSKVKATLSAEWKYSATASSYSMMVQGKTYGSPYESDYLSTSGNVDVIGKATDSRGFPNTATQKITVIPYSKPSILPASGESAIICARCDENGNLSESGTYLKIKAQRSYRKVVASGVQKNFCSIRYRYKAEDASSYSDWTTILASNSASDEVTTNALLGGALLKTSSYMVQVGVIDDIGESDTITFRIPTDKVYMHRAGSMNSLGIGKYAEDDNTVDIAEDITLKVRGNVEFMGEAWISRELGTNVKASTVHSGRWGGTGVYYRVCAGGKHVYVAFNVSFTTSTSTVRAESETIPNKPDYDVYALCPVGFADGSRGIATASVSPNGRVNIYAVHKLPGATLSTGETVNWIDGYIDYWV